MYIVRLQSVKKDSLFSHKKIVALLSKVLYFVQICEHDFFFHSNSACMGYMCSSNFLHLG